MFSFLFGVCFLSACINTPVEKQPNILWIYLEDTSPLLGCYGETLIATPNIDNLAKNGTLYTNAFMPAPVCSASRSSIITGVMSTTLGMHNHHSARTQESAIYLPEDYQTIPEIFKSEGYFTFNNGKDDYNFTYDRKDLYTQPYRVHPMYGKSGLPIDLKILKQRSPFFGQIQLKGGKEIFSSSFKENVKNPVDRSSIKLPPYLPDHPVIIEEYANHLDAIQITDERVGQIIRGLEESELLSNTIVFFFSDHGMRMTRHKQFLYDGGIKVPLIIADFRDRKAMVRGGRNDGLISGLDLGTSSLALAGIPIPEYMEGLDMLGEDVQSRDFVISTRDRCDFTIDRIRSVRTKQFKYIRNFKTDRPYTQNTYMDVDSVPFVITMKKLHNLAKLDTIQDRFFLDKRPSEELYDITADPFELNNLASNSEYKAELKEHADMLDQWIEETDDKGAYPESAPGLKLMLGIWGDYIENPEYDSLNIALPDLAGSMWEFKSQGWKEVR